ncbi:MAG: methyltransferase domain-containing protein [Cyclobacteriaceae bacterium]|nr:methyltransferase domain-containing protein [Cyclobacteriaceae bacterium]
MDTEQIQIRYSALAEDTCCLSCGSAIDYSKAQPGEVCVDLGSGRGTDVLRLAEDVGDTGFVYGIDVSDGMLKKAKKNAAKLGVTNVEFIKSKLEDIKIQSDTVNLIISNCTINHASDKFKVWSEIERILQKSGRFVVSDIYSIGEVPEEYRNDPEAVAECWAGATTKQKYLDTLMKVGFKDIEIIEESSPYAKGEIEVVSFTIVGKKKCCG